MRGSAELKTLVAKLKAIRLDMTLDTEGEHAAADEALIEFIGDREVTDAYNAIKKWYA